MLVHKCFLLMVVFQQTASIFRCKNFRTIDDTNLCDGIDQCQDAVASDECGCNDTVINACLNERCVVKSNLCDGKDDCKDGFASDEQNCDREDLILDRNQAENFCNQPLSVRCGDKLTCISHLELCDGKFDCPDMSDEQYSGPGFKCVINSVAAPTCVLPQINLYDNQSHCYFDADLCFDSDGLLTSDCFLCLDGNHIISKFQVCNGVLDCMDFSDECLCNTIKTPHVCKDDLPRKLSKSKLMTNFNTTINNRLKPVWLPRAIDCGDGSYIDSSSLCDGLENCVSGTDEAHCFSPNTLAYISNIRNTFLPLMEKIPDFFNESFFQNSSLSCYNGRFGWILARLCDGVPLCDNLEDECNSRCTDQPDYCRSNISCFPGHLVCDGKWDSDQADNCSNKRILEEETDCLNRFYCINGRTISLRLDQVCDGVVNCDDGSDESKERNCQDQRHYCENSFDNNLSANPFFVQKALVLDGKKDCEDGSDECPTYLIKDSFSYKNKMISKIFLTILLWIIGPLSFFGNLYIFSTTVNVLIKKKLPNKIALIHHIMITNLAVADGLMGIYLMSLCVVSAYVSGNFCMIEKTWRASYLCKIMGTFVIVSTQASVFILLLMGVFRLYTILKPFERQFSSNCYSYITKSLIIVWIFAISLGLLPWVLNFSNTHYYFKSLFFETDSVLKSDYDKFAEKIALQFQRNNSKKNLTIFRFENVSVNGVLKRRQFEINLKPNLKYEGELGFYSKNAICLPNYLTRSNEPGWKLTLFIITLNFVCFIVMAVMYFLIVWYSHPKRHPLLRSSTINRKNAAKLNFLKCKFHCRVARLILTDFLCWIPLCCLSYAHFSGIDYGEMMIAICGIVLLPINSALNPILYSDLYDSLVACSEKYFPNNLRASFSKFSMKKSTNTFKTSVTFQKQLKESDDQSVKVEEN